MEKKVNIDHQRGATKDYPRPDAGGTKGHSKPNTGHTQAGPPPPPQPQNKK